MLYDIVAFVKFLWEYKITLSIIVGSYFTICWISAPILLHNPSIAYNWPLAERIKHYFSERLIQPEWLGHSEAAQSGWYFDECAARFLVVVIICFFHRITGLFRWVSKRVF